MKKLLALSLCLVIVFSLVGCGALGTIKDIKDAVNQDENKVDTPVVSDPIEQGNKTEQETPTQPETPVEKPTSSIEEEMQNVANAFLKANIDSQGLMDLVGIFNSDYELVEHTKYYNDSLLCKAMVKDSVFTNVSKANSLTVKNVETLSRGVYAVELKNDLGAEFKLNIIKVEDNYLVDIADLFLPANLCTSDGVEPYLNGILLSEDDFTEYGTYGNRRYHIPYILAHIENTMEYETNYSESFNKIFIVDKASDEFIELRYLLNLEDLQEVAPKVADLWTSLHTAAKNKDAAGVSALLTDDSPLLVNTLIDGHQTKTKLTIKQFELREGSACYLASDTCLLMNLRAVFIGEYSYGTRTPSEFNWVVIEIQENGSYKIRDASTNVWVNGDINGYSND